MHPCMYLFLNKELGMSTGKAAAQASHAAVEAYRISGSNFIEAWYVGGHYMKLVMEARDEGHIKTIHHYLSERGFDSKVIIDEGRTEIAPHTITALGVAIVDKDHEHTAATFEGFRLYKDPKPEVTMTLSSRAARAFKMK